MKIKGLLPGYEMGKKFVERHNFQGETALDIGAGHCGHTIAFAEKFDHVDAIDINDIRYQPGELLKISPHAKKIRFIKMDAHDINKLKPYDLVYSLSAMEHMSDLKDILNKLPAITQKQFYLVISPLFYSPLGHHLDPEIGEWEHLILPEEELKARFFANGGASCRWQIYKELNKVTAAELIEIAKNNFKITFLKVDITTIEMLCEKQP